MLTTRALILFTIASVSPFTKSASKQTLTCPDGRVIETKVKGSQQQRKKTANQKIEKLKQSFLDLPNWQAKKSPNSLLQVIEYNCAAKKLPKGWNKVCEDRKTLTVDNIYSYIEANFTPYQMLVENNEIGKFTSYYASYVNVNEKKEGKYKYPIYRMSDKATKLSRKQIEAGKLPESEVLFWADNAFDAYILAIQGSGVGKLPDGSKVKILYGGKNKKNYVSLGKVLRECGEINPSKISLPSIRAWVDQSSETKYQRLVSNNQSYVFFVEGEYNGEQPIGALGVPLTAMRSLAVDTRYIPLGTMAYSSVGHPLDEEKIEQVFIAQDKGGAINGGIRADIFAGEGDEAAKFAGNMAHLGKFWLLLPND